MIGRFWVLNEMEWVCKHLGHTINIHKDYYRYILTSFTHISLKYNSYVSNLFTSMYDPIELITVDWTSWSGVRSSFGNLRVHVVLFL